MHKFIKDMLECPSCHGELNWDIKDETNERIVNATIICDKCGADYEVRNTAISSLTS